jgi:RNA polymerase sigma-70 factor (ECF subfamily)
VRGANIGNAPGVTETTCRSGTSASREVDLITRIADGDRSAFEELYSLYHRRLARFLTRVTSRSDVVEEVINDTFWIVWRRARNFRGDSQLSTWIFGIAYRTGRKALRSTSKTLTGENPEAAAAPIASDEPLRTEELQDWLVQALVQLPLEQRLSVELCYELGHSCEEIATIMSCPVNTVKARLFYARAKLRKLLPLLGGFPDEASARGSP